MLLAAGLWLSVPGRPAGALAATPPAAAVERDDYYELAAPLAGAPYGTLTKIFRYDCPACRRFDTTRESLVVPRVKDETSLSYNPMHLGAGARFGRTASEFFALCRIQDAAAGLAADDPGSLFHRARGAAYESCLQERWLRPVAESTFVQMLCEASGISPAAFEKERAGAAVQQLCALWQGAYGTARIQGIPAFVVNGRYLLKTTAVASADDFVARVVRLSRLPAQGRPQAGPAAQTQPLRAVSSQTSP